MTDTEKAEQMAREMDGWYTGDPLLLEMRDALVWLLQQYAKEKTPAGEDRG